MLGLKGRSKKGKLKAGGLGGLRSKLAGKAAPKAPFGGVSAFANKMRANKAAGAKRPTVAKPAAGAGRSRAGMVKQRLR